MSKRFHGYRRRAFICRIVGHLIVIGGCGRCKATSLQIKRGER